MQTPILMGEMAMKFFTYIKKSQLRGESIILADDYVTNGHWMIRKAAIENKEWFESWDTLKANCKAVGENRFNGKMTNDTAERAMPKDLPEKEWRVSEYLYDTGSKYGYRQRLLVSLDGTNTVAALQQDFLDILGFEVGDTLYAESDLSVFTDEQMTRIVMPVRHDLKVPLAA